LRRKVARPSQARLELGGEDPQAPEQEHFKDSLRLLPLLSCSTSLSQQIYDPKDHLQRFKTAMETLREQQLKMRADTSGRRSELKAELTKNLRKTAMNYLSKKAKQSSKKPPKS
jgi:hypothetical protein